MSLSIYGSLLEVVDVNNRLRDAGLTISSIVKLVIRDLYMVELLVPCTGNRRYHAVEMYVLFPRFEAKYVSSVNYADADIPLDGGARQAYERMNGANQTLLRGGVMSVTWDRANTVVIHDGRRRLFVTYDSQGRVCKMNIEEGSSDASAV